MSNNDNKSRETKEEPVTAVGKTKYRLFAGFYESNGGGGGGYDNYFGSSHDYEELKEMASDCEWAHIVNDKDEIILRYGYMTYKYSDGGQREGVHTVKKWKFT